MHDHMIKLDMERLTHDWKSRVCDLQPIKTKLLAEFEAHANFGKPEQEKLMPQAIVDNDFPDHEVL